MSISTIKNTVSKNLINIPGWKTNRKLIVFESDDWGSIRMPSKVVFDELLKSGIRVNKCPYCSNDRLESEDDLTALFTVLTRFKDANGNHPVITANAIMANPDFQKIEDSGFSEYHYEVFTETFKKYPGCHNSFSLWKQGMDANIFMPQLHGREHVNVSRWMAALQSNAPETMLAFKQGLFGISTTITNEKRKSYLPAFDFDTVQQQQSHAQIIKEGAAIFKKVIGYAPVSFIAPNYTWHKSLEDTLFTLGIKTIQSTKMQVLPQEGTAAKKVKHYTGQKSSSNMVYTLRNGLFEPSESDTDWVSKSLKDIDIAFRWKKPAILSTHRLNFIGGINENNRTKNLNQLNSLLAAIVKKWPEAEFISSGELATIITN